MLFQEYAKSRVNSLETIRQWGIVIGADEPMVNELYPSGQTLQERITGGPQPWIDAEDQHDRTCVRIIARRRAVVLTAMGVRLLRRLLLATGRAVRQSGSRGTSCCVDCLTARPLDGVSYPTCFRISSRMSKFAQECGTST